VAEAAPASLLEDSVGVAEADSEPAAELEAVSVGLGEAVEEAPTGLAVTELS